MKHTMKSVPLWFEHKFDFTLPVEQYPYLHIRLWGSPARLEEMLRNVSRDRLIEKPGGKWSAQEHAGHLADLEQAAQNLSVVEPARDGPVTSLISRRCVTADNIGS